MGKINEDAYVTHVPLFKQEKIAYTSVPLYYYFTNPDGIMRSKFSLKQLDLIPAVRHPVDFFIEKNYNSLIKPQISSLFYNENSIFRQLKENGYKQEASSLKKEIKKDANYYKQYISFRSRCAFLSASHWQYKLFLHFFALPAKMGFRRKKQLWKKVICLKRR